MIQKIKKDKLKFLIKKSLLGVFAIYIGILLFVLVFKFPTGLVRNAIVNWMNGGEFYRMQPQLVPFKTIINYIGHVEAVHDWFFKNLACNIIMFVPYGFLLPFVLKNKTKRAVRVIISGIVISVSIEAFQYITALGLCDIDDVILNTIGVLLGFFAYKLTMLEFKLVHKFTGLLDSLV